MTAPKRRKPASKAASKAATQDTSGGGDVPLWHWIASAIGMLFTLGCIGVLVYEGLREPDGPVRVEATVENVVPQTGAFLVQVRVENLSRTPAASVVIRGELRRGDAVVEDAEATLETLAGRSTRRLGLLFTQDPRSGGLTVRAVSFLEP